MGMISMEEKFTSIYGFSRHNQELAHVGFIASKIKNKLRPTIHRIVRQNIRHCYVLKLVAQT